MNKLITKAKNTMRNKILLKSMKSFTVAGMDGGVIEMNHLCNLSDQSKMDLVSQSHLPELAFIQKIDHSSTEYLCEFFNTVQRVPLCGHLCLAIGEAKKSPRIKGLELQTNCGVVNVLYDTKDNNKTWISKSCMMNDLKETRYSPIVRESYSESQDKYFMQFNSRYDFRNFDASNEFYQNKGVLAYTLDSDTEDNKVEVSYHRNGIEHPVHLSGLFSLAQKLGGKEYSFEFHSGQKVTVEKDWKGQYSQTTDIKPLTQDLVETVNYR